MTNTRITFETETCYRCGGTGEYPSPAWQGMCLGCNRKGYRLTRRGRAASNKYQTLMDEEMLKAYPELAVGDRVSYDPGKYTTVTEVSQDAHGGWIVKTPKVLMHGTAETRILVWNREIWLSIVARVGKMKGATVTGGEPAPVEAPVKAAKSPAPAPKPAGRTSHADCDHEATPKARAACRKARATAQPTITDDTPIPGLEGVTVRDAKRIAEHVKARKNR